MNRSCQFICLMLLATIASASSPPIIYTGGAIGKEVLWGDFPSVTTSYDWYPVSIAHGDDGEADTLSTIHITGLSAISSPVDYAELAIGVHSFTTEVPGFRIYARKAVSPANPSTGSSQYPSYYYSGGSGWTTAYVPFTAVDGFTGTYRINVTAIVNELAAQSGGTGTSVTFIFEPTHTPNGVSAVTMRFMGSPSLKVHADFDGDADFDGVADLLDNCVNVSNGPYTSGFVPTSTHKIQRDTDGDGFGNLCDGDFDGDGDTDSADQAVFNAAYPSTTASGNWNANADLTGNGAVDDTDNGLFTALLSSPPGPGSAGSCQGQVSNWTTNCAFQGDNQYDWDVWAELPDCSVAAADKLHIDDDSDWNQINSSTYRIFCVHPGDYRAWNSGGVLNLTQDGTSNSPRWIILYDPDNPNDKSHPSLLAEGDRAIMPQFSIESADHWRIVRMTVKGYQCVSGDCPGRVRGTVGTRFSHMLIEDGAKSGFPYVVKDGSNVRNGNYIFQYNVIRNITPAVADQVAFYLEDCASQPCTVVRNEVYNPAADHLTIAANPDGGIRVDENEFYMTESRRVNCTDGSQTPPLNCAPNETMLVIKGSTETPTSTTYITNNVFHHSYDLYAAGCCSQSVNAPAHAINIGSGGVYLVTDVVVENNIVYDSSGGISFRWDVGYSGAEEIQVKRNLLSNVRSTLQTETAFHTWSGPGHVETYNVIVDTDAYLGSTSYGGAYKTHQCNVAIDGGSFAPAYANSGGSWANNYAYGSTTISSNNDTGYVSGGGSAADADHDDLCIVTNFITNPTQHCVYYGKVTEESAHEDCTVDLE